MLIPGNDPQIVQDATGRAQSALGACDCGEGALEPLDAQEKAFGCRSCGATLTHHVRTLPCHFCRTHAALSIGEPYRMGSSPVKFPFRYRCARCRRSMVIDAPGFNALPLRPA